jgi:DNA-directed RNA polymerase subunit RPC12/RpoP
VTAFDLPWLRDTFFRQYASKTDGPLPDTRPKCDDCGRPWEDLPESERDPTGWRCWPCRHRRLDPASASGDGLCTDTRCPRHSPGAFIDEGTAAEDVAAEGERDDDE